MDEIHGMSTYTQILYQIVFTTKDHESTMIEYDEKYLFYDVEPLRGSVRFGSVVLSKPRILFGAIHVEPLRGLIRC